MDLIYSKGEKMLDSLYAEALKKKGQINDELDEFKESKIQVEDKWNSEKIVPTKNNVVIAAGDGSVNKKKYLSFNFYAVAAESLIYDETLETIETVEIDTIPHQSFVDDRLRNKMAVFEIKNAIRALNKYEIDYYLDDGSLMGDLIRPSPSANKLSKVQRDNIIKKVQEAVKKDIENDEDDIQSFDFKKEFPDLYEDENLDEDALTSFLENIEKIIALSYFLKHKRQIVAISKTSSTNEIFHVNIPDIALFDKAMKTQGFSDPYYRSVSSRVKHEFPVEDEFFRTLEFTVFFARLEDYKNIIKIELPYHANKNEIRKILADLKKDSVEGYPFLLKKAHNDVVIKNKDIAQLSKIVGLVEKTGREML